MKKHHLLVGVSVLVLAMSTFAGAAWKFAPQPYPPLPAVIRSSVTAGNAYELILNKNQKVHIDSNFVGSATGCGIMVHDMTTQKVDKAIVAHKHDIGQHTEVFKDDIKAVHKTTYLLSEWTFDYTHGWTQVAPHNSVVWTIGAGGSAQFTCTGSPNGPTESTVTLSVGP